mmetsp:Transcript_39085/g.28893  ORF Transcript_39085/g.28893 Transcript_39085/m.28893 type:complete len:138 (+) Transcript_39085:318-731(+)
MNEYGCNSVCYCRGCMPEAHIYDEGQRLIGTVVMMHRRDRPMYKGVELWLGYDRSKLLMRILYYYCCYGCTGCSLDFEIEDQTGSSAGNQYIIKEGLDCMTECGTARDKYNFNLPINENEAALVIGAIHFMDMKFFS